MNVVMADPPINICPNGLETHHKRFHKFARESYNPPSCFTLHNSALGGGSQTSPPPPPSHPPSPVPSVQFFVL